jgi:hypothetical protein
MMRDAQEAADILKHDLGAASRDAGDSMTELTNASRSYSMVAQTVTVPALQAVSRDGVLAGQSMENLAAHFSLMEQNLAASHELENLPLRIRVAKDNVVAAQKDLEKARGTAQHDAARLRLKEAKDEVEQLSLLYSDKKATKAAEDAMAAFGMRLGYNLRDSFTLGAGSAVVTLATQARVKGALPRAGGGPVDAGVAYRVGETRPEYFVPQQDGYITPNRPGSQVAEGVTIKGITPAQLVDMVDREMYFRLRRQPATAGRV